MKPSEALWNAVWAHRGVRSHHDTVVTALRALGVQEALEIGAGSGRDLDELARMGIRVVYSDFSRQAVASFSARSPSIPGVQGSATDLPFGDDTFECAYSLGLLEHFDKSLRLGIIREHFRVAHSTVLIDVPQLLAPTFIVKRTLMAVNRWPYGEETQFTLWSLKKEVKEALGYDPGVVGSYGREYVPLPRNLKSRVYDRFPGWARRLYLSVREPFAFGLAGSFGLIFASSRGTAGDLLRETA